MSETLIPVTVLTGFLGAGKTTLLNRILSERHGRRIAVIENEFGAVGIDDALLVQRESEDIVVMNNGCICCTVRGDLVRILGELASRHAQGELAFERIVIESTGLADPAPIAQTFFVEEAIRRHFRLDAIVTVVDAKHAWRQLDEHHEAQEQVGFADRLLVSKTDLVTEADYAALAGRLRQINLRAPIRRMDFGRADLDDILDVHGFNLNDILAIEPDFLVDVDHAHDDDIRSFVIRERRPYLLERLEVALGGLLEEHGPDLLRYKGILNIAGNPNQVVFQGVHMIMGGHDYRPWREGEPRESTLVFIGRDLPEAEFRAMIAACRAAG